MKKITTLCIFAIVCLGSVMAQDKITSDKQLPIMAWAGIPAEETNVDRLKQVRSEIQNFSGVFSGAKDISVAHTGLDIPNETKRLSQLPDPIKLLETVGVGAVVSVLENGKNTFIVIVNRDFKNPMKLIIYTDDSVRKVLRDGTLLPAKEYANATEVEPGDVSIYMFPTTK